MGSKPKPTIDYAEVERLASQGLTQEQICSCIGISTSTLHKYKRTNAEFAEALKKGQHRGIEEVTNALMENARAGNLGAQVFYLKNRDRENWKDKQDLEHSGDLQHHITVETGTGNVGPDETD